MKTVRILLIAVLMMALPLAAVASGMTLKNIAELEQVAQATVSPDGSHVAYIRVVQRDPLTNGDGGAWTELHVIGPDGDSIPFITGEVNIQALAWTPDSRHITYLAQRDSDEQQTLYRIPRAGGESRRLASLPEGIRGYSISPDGERIALMGFEEDPEELVEQRDKGFTQIVFEEDWKPVRLWLRDIDDGAEAEAVDLDGSVQEVQWSPAGDRIAIKITPRQLVDDTLMFNRIRILDTEGTETGRIDNPGKLGEMAWSPDGEHIAFIATDTVHDTREGRLLIAGKNGGEFENLLPELEGHVWGVNWRDDNRIVFISHEGVWTRLGEIRPDGSEEQTLREGENGLIWNAISVSDDGDLVMLAHSTDHPVEVYRLEGDDLEPERLTVSNDWLDDVELARQEVVTYTARDGLEIEGILFYPLDHAEGQRYPLILAVHGGPEAHYNNGWLTSYNLPAQVAAAEGYFMFYPNYRGSTGRGVEFALTSQGRPAAEEFDDLIDGVDHLIDEGLVDGDRVGITGGSYGGYASAWGATYYSERFAAAVMNVGLSDKISMLGTSDIPQELYLVHYLTWPWEDWDMYKEASPIYYASQAQTPILILHGDADPRVDPTQSRILYRYLTLQEDPPPVRMVLYRGEGHGNQRATSRWDYSLRLMRWMEHYLKDDGGEPPEYQLDYGFAENDD